MRFLSRLVAPLTLFAAGTLQAQEASVPRLPDAPADTALVASPAPTSVTLRGSFMDHPTVGVARQNLTESELSAWELTALQDSTSGIKGFLFGTQRRKSNTFIVGGIVTSAIGVGVIKGHGGAIVGVGGLLMSIYGFYLMF
jgi:hypothetical protein